MAECIALARNGAGSVSPNPMVGAVLVVAGRVVARGYHKKFGGPHAEVECLRDYRGDLRHATLYVNLEPCSHFGKTPPCADMLVASGIRTVVVAMKDPNPLVSGRGIARMRRAGMDVRVGVFRREAEILNRMFLTHIALKRPYVHVKIAESLDGYIAGGAERWISSPESRRIVHEWRATHDAVLVGAGTVKADNPSLDVRLVRGRNPAVVVLDGGLTVSPRSALFSSQGDRRVYVCARAGAIRRQRAKARLLMAKGVTLLSFSGRLRQLAMKDILTALYRKGIGSLLVEGGSEVFAWFAASGTIDEFSLFVAPRFIGKGVRAFASLPEPSSPASAFIPRNFQSTSVGKDILIKGFADNFRGK